ncbi:MAG: hypothetical protein AAF490_12175 [Chloroflexota bacterium]
MKKLLLIGLGLLLLCSISSIFLYRFFTIGDVERYSGVNIPTRALVPTMTHSGETFQIIETKIPLQNREKFILEYSFVQVPFEDPRIQQHSRFFERMFDGRENFIDPDFYLHIVCNDSRNWTFLLNNQSGQLWVIDRFPDFAGDSSPCPADAVDI